MAAGVGGLLYHPPSSTWTLMVLTTAYNLDTLVNRDPQ